MSALKMCFYHQIADIHLSEHAFLFSHQRLSQTQIKQRDDSQSQSRVLRLSLHSACTAPLWLFEPLGGVLLLRHSGSLLGRPKGLEIIYQVSKVEAALFFLSVHPSPQPKEERGCQESVMLLRSSGFASWNFGCETAREFVAARTRL